MRRRRRVLAIAMTIVAISGCSSSAPGLDSRSVLFVVPQASDIHYGPGDRSVSYRVADSYPASATFMSLREGLTRAGCIFAQRDPFDQPPYNRWIENSSEENDLVTRSWVGAWTCTKNAIVVFTVRTTRRADERWSDANLEASARAFTQQEIAAQRGSVQPGTIDLSESALELGGTGSTSYESCTVCGATRKQVNDGPWRILYRGDTSPSHRHAWKDGVNSAGAVDDDRVVLARIRTSLDAPAYEYAAFILTSQRFEPNERTDYRWVLRTEGGGILDAADPAVMTGTARDQGRIVFGPFRIPWSARSAGRGFVYYPRFAGAGRSSEDWELCITNLTSFAGLNAADPKFIYKTSPLD